MSTSVDCGISTIYQSYYSVHKSHPNVKQLMKYGKTLSISIKYMMAKSFLQKDSDYLNSLITMDALNNIVIPQKEIIKTLTLRIQAPESYNNDYYLVKELTDNSKIEDICNSLEPRLLQSSTKINLYKGNEPLNRSYTLTECNIHDGDILFLGIYNTSTGFDSFLVYNNFQINNEYDYNINNIGMNSRFIDENPFDNSNPHQRFFQSSYLKQYNNFDMLNITNNSIIKSIPDDLFDIIEIFNSMEIDWKIEEKCIKLWTLQSTIYKSIKSCLYTDDEDEIVQYLPIICGCNMFIKNHPLLNEEMVTTFRGSKMSDKQFAFYKIGTTYRIPAFCSTSKNENIAKSWANMKCIITFRIPKNCYNAASVKNFSDYPEEDEVLLPAYTAFTVLSKTNNSLEVEVLNNKETANDVLSAYI